MEFHFRSANNRLPLSSAAASSSPFAAHASRAGMVPSSETETRMLEPTPLSAPITDPMWEMREQIRLEVMREMEQKRLLKEEVRREIEMEQAMATRWGWGHGGFSWPGPGGIAMGRPDTTLSSLISQARLVDKMDLLHSLKPRDQGLAMPAKVEGGTSNFCTAGTKRKTSLTFETSKTLRSSEGWNCALCQVSATSKEALDDHLSGKKHKSREALLSKGADETSNQVSAENVSRPVFLPIAGDETWRCSLCQVTATSKKGLDEHLIGRKHKAREARTGAHKGGDRNDDSCISVQRGTDHALIGKLDLKDSASDNNAGLIDKEQCSTNTTFVKKNPVKRKSKKKYLLCRLCKVKSNSQSNYSIHLQGKRHKAQLELSNSTLHNGPTKEPVIGVENPSAEGTAPMAGEPNDTTEEGKGENGIKVEKIRGGE